MCASCWPSPLFAGIYHRPLLYATIVWPSPTLASHSGQLPTARFTACRVDAEVRNHGWVRFPRFPICTSQPVRIRCSTRLEIIGRRIMYASTNVTRRPSQRAAKRDKRRATRTSLRSNSFPPVNSISGPRSFQSRPWPGPSPKSWPWRKVSPSPEAPATSHAAFLLGRLLFPHNPFDPRPPPV